MMASLLVYEAFNALLRPSSYVLSRDHGEMRVFMAEERKHRIFSQIGLNATFTEVSDIGRAARFRSWVGAAIARAQIGHDSNAPIRIERLKV